MPPLTILCLLSDAFGSHGGISKFNRDLLTALSGHPGSPEIIALPRLMNEPPGQLPPGIQWLTHGLGGKLNYLRAVWKTALVMRKRAQKPPESPACNFIICGHINLLPAAFLARRILGHPTKNNNARTRPPIALIIHGIEVWNRHRSFLVKRLLGKLNAIISVSDFTLQRFLKWSGTGKVKTMILPNCVDFSAFSPGPKAVHLLQKYNLADRKVIMTLGRLVQGRPKGIDEILDLLPNLVKEVPGLSYLIVGDGPDRPRLAAKARALGLMVLDHDSSQLPSPISYLPSPALPPQVVFTGRISEEEKAAHYRVADAFVMPGYGEGFGIVYLEALASGIPVLASTLDASREALLDGKLGAIVNPRDPHELEEAILQILSQPRGIVSPLLEYFSFPEFKKRVHAIVDALCLRKEICPS